MTRVAFAIPGDLSARTGGYGYDRRVLAALPDHGIDAVYLPLPGAFPFPDANGLAQALARLREAEADILLVDGLAWGALPPDECRRIATPVVALVHHPLGLEAGLDPSQAQALIANERGTLTACRHIVVTSDTTRDTLLSDFGIAPSRVTVAEPGTDPAPRAPCNGEPPHLLAIGSIIPRKAFDVLLRALGNLTHLPWTLELAGSPDRAPQTAAALFRLAKDLGLQGRIVFSGERDHDELEAAYARADLFISSSLYEGYGMVLGEALAHGLPVITTTGGAAARTVPDPAGLKVPPGDVAALQAALERAIGDAGLRRSLADAAWRAGQALPRWNDTAARIARALKTIATGTTT